MTANDRARCEDWVKAHAMSWQTLNRAQWKYQFHEKTLVRYVDEASMREDEVKLILEYLASDDCIATLCLYDQALDPSWQPVRAWYEISNKAHGNIHGVRLYHGLNTAPEAEADGPYVVEDGCVYKVSWTYYWKQPTVIAVPASTSGVSYRIGSLNRDPDTGLFSYILEKRERVQQDIPLYLQAETIYERHQTEQHLGVKQSDVDTTGLAAGVGNGVLTQRTLSKNSDCTTDVSNTVETEKSVSNAVVERSKKLHAVTVSTTDKNMPTAITDTVGTLKVGETVRSQKTPGGLYDNTHTQVDEEEVGLIGEDCAKTIFKHDHKTHSNVAEKPVPSEAAAAGGGHTYAKSSRQTEYSTWDVTESVSTENPVENAVVERRMTLHGLSESVTNRNQSSPLPVPSEIGHSVVSRKTEGGLYDTTETIEGKTPAGLIGEGCTHDAFSHHHSETRNEAEPQDVETEFVPGKVIRKTARLTSNGTADNSTDTTTAVPQKNAYTYRREDGATIHIVKYRNQTNTPSFPNGAAGLTVHDSINEFGLHDGSICWATGVSSQSTVNSLQFIKHGASVKIYETYYSKRKRKWFHREWTVQRHHIRGDAYTDYLSEKDRADPGRTSNGPLYVKLIAGPYSDAAGNLLAEWEWITLTNTTQWTECGPACKDKHPRKITGKSEIRDALKKLLGDATAGGTGGMDVGRSLVDAIRELPLSLSMAITGMGRRDVEMRFTEANAGASNGGGR